MQMIRGIQLREPYAHSSGPYSNYNQLVSCAEFVVKRQSDGKKVNVDVFFPRSSAPQQGVGLSFPSVEVAIAVGRALLTVAEGYLGEMGGRF